MFTSAVGVETVSVEFQENLSERLEDEHFESEWVPFLFRGRRFHVEALGDFGRHGRPAGVDGTGWSSPPSLLPNVSDSSMCASALLRECTSVQFGLCFGCMWWFGCRRRLCTTDD